MNEENKRVKDSVGSPEENAPDALPSVFIGQEKILEKIAILVDKANKSKMPLPHMLFIGEEGMGKRTLVYMTAKKLGAKITETSASMIHAGGDLVGILTNLEKGDILFIDEIHKLSKIIIEFLYPAMENCQIDLVIDKGPYAKSVKFNLKPFTLIATTSNFTKLPEELINRFYCVYKFSPYTETDFLQILQNKAKSKGVNLDEEAIKYFAEKLVGSTAKIFLVNKVVGFATISETKTITKEIIDECLSTIETSGEPIEEDIRRSVPNKVRVEVWRRDEGKCVNCGSRENLEYDHIIPVSKGGSNTARNIELLCEKCNREKHDNIQ